MGRSLWGWVAVLLMTWGISACGLSMGFGSGSKSGATPSTGQDAGDQFFVIDVDRGSVAEQFLADRTLRVNRVEVSPQFSSDALLLRIDDHQYTASTGDKLLRQPDVMLQAQIQRWMQKSGLFSQVVQDGEAATEYTLSTHVSALYGEARPAFPSLAVMELEFFLTTTTNGAVRMRFQTGYRVEVDLDNTTSASLVSGWNQALEEVLFALEADLSDYFSKAQPPIR